MMGAGSLGMIPGSVEGVFHHLHLLSTKKGQRSYTRDAAQSNANSHPAEVIGTGVGQGELMEVDDPQNDMQIFIDGQIVHFDGVFQKLETFISFGFHQSVLQSRIQARKLNESSDVRQQFAVFQTVGGTAADLRYSFGGESYRLPGFAVLAPFQKELHTTKGFTLEVYLAVEYRNSIYSVQQTQNNPHPYGWGLFWLCSGIRK